MNFKIENPEKVQNHLMEDTTDEPIDYILNSDGNGRYREVHSIKSIQSEIEIPVSHKNSRVKILNINGVDNEYVEKIIIHPSIDNIGSLLALPKLKEVVFCVEDDWNGHVLQIHSNGLPMELYTMIIPPGVRLNVYAPRHMMFDGLSDESLQSFYMAGFDFRPLFDGSAENVDHGGMREALLPILWIELWKAVQSGENKKIKAAMFRLKLLWKQIEEAYQSQMI